ncbi:MAG: hypothetical protein FJ011_15365 [Chloroflexi bacterium]|nr:hypothetical protein [Chloroflexota bacterium]
MKLSPTSDAPGRTNNPDAAPGSPADAVIVFDAQGRPVSASLAAIAAFGFDPVGIERQALISALGISWPDGRPLTVADLPSSQALAGKEVQGERLCFTDATGRDVTVAASAYPLLANGKTIGAISIWRGVSQEEPPAGERQIAWSRPPAPGLRPLVQVQEAERRRIARELHDEIGQALTALKINLQTMQRQIAAAELSRQLDESIAIVERTLQQVRDMSLDLRPSLLDDLGLVAALRWYVTREGRGGARPHPG